MDSFDIPAILPDLQIPYVQGKARFSDGCKQHLLAETHPCCAMEERSGAWPLVTVTTARAAHLGFAGD